MSNNYRGIYKVWRNLNLVRQTLAVLYFVQPSLLSWITVPCIKAEEVAEM